MIKIKSLTKKNEPYHGIMKFQDHRKKICIYINRKDKFEGKALYEALLEEFLKIEVSGCSVFYTLASYGGNFVVHGNMDFPLFRNKGIMLQVIETEKKVNQILNLLESMIPNGMVTIEDIEMIRYNKIHPSEKDQEIADTSDSSSSSIGKPYSGSGTL